MSTKAITWAELARLKKAAKAAQSDLTHMQRLDALAAAEHGVRHFHELQKRYEAFAASHIDSDGGAHHCRYCSFTFDGSLRADVDEHKRRHRLYEDAEIVLGFVPMPYKEREQVKRTGYDMVRSANADSQRTGALAILLAHFDRSLERAIGGGRWHKHPCFTEYIAHALPGAGFVPTDVRALLAKEFGESAEVMAAGQTDWPSQTDFKVHRLATGAAVSGRLRAALLQATEAEETAASAS